MLYIIINIILPISRVLVQHFFLENCDIEIFYSEYDLETLYLEHA
jgi:hypothetical protein